MTRKHFEALARSLKELRQDLQRGREMWPDTATKTAYEAHVDRIIALCRLNNSAFDTSQFRNATL